MKKPYCNQCGVFHSPLSPHYKDSPKYQKYFHDKYGRYPSWLDAMDHCTQEIKSLWVEELRKRDIDVEGSL